MIVSSSTAPASVPVPPLRLTSQEIEAWRANGLLVRDEVLPEADLLVLDQAMRACGLEDEIRQASGQVMHLELLSLHPAFLRLARDERILGCVVSLLGPNVAIEHTKLSAQPHGPGGGVQWHQDLAFYPHTNPDVLAVMVMLDDATPDNGCMRMIRGSHRLGYLDHADEDGLFLGACRDQRPWEDHPGMVDITPRRGGISIHHGFTLHSSGTNRSGHPRRGLVLNYRAADAYQLADMAFADTGLIVSGSYPGYARLEGTSIPLPRFPDTWGRDAHGTAWHQVGAWAADEHRRMGLDVSGAVRSGSIR